MPRKSRETLEEEAIVLLLRARTEESLERILAEVAPRRRDLVAPARDNRFCQTCGLRFPRCRALYTDDHDFVPPKHTPREPVE